MDMEEKNNQSIKEKVQSYIPILATKATKYRFTILFVILGGAIGFALLGTQTYIQIPRNEQRYSDETLKIKYKRIDQEALNTLKQKQQDGTIEVNSQYDPDRDNPFTE